MFVILSASRIKEKCILGVLVQTGLWEPVPYVGATWNVSLKIFRPRTGLGNTFEGACPDC